MPPDLSEFQSLLEGEQDYPGLPRKPTRDEFVRTAQVLLTRQCIYSSTPGIGRAYEVAKAYSPFYEAYFAVLGYRMAVSHRDQMVSLSVPKEESRYDAVYERLRKDEVMVLLALRLIWEEAVSGQDIQEGGIAETTTGDLIDRLKAVSQSGPPEEARLAEILRLFQKHGAVRTGERDRIERVTPLSILPGVSVIAPDSYLEELSLWAAATATADDLPDFTFEEPADE